MRQQLDRRHAKDRGRLPVPGIALALILAALVRCVLLPIAYGHDFVVWDQATRYLVHGINPYTRWRHMANPYAYPPVFLYLDLPMQWLALHTGVSFVILGKLPMAAADLVVGATLYRWLCNAGRSSRLAVTAACLYLFNPLVLYNSAFLGRFDSVALAFFLPALMARGYRFALLYGLAIATKTFPIFILPALLFGRYRRPWRELAGTLLVIAIVSLPFLLWNPGAFFFNVVVLAGKMAPYPMGLSWHFVLKGMMPHATYEWLLRVFYVLFLVAIVLWRDRPPITRCALILSLFLLVDHKIWEQYLTWPLPFLIALALLRRDVKAALLAVGLTVAAVFNNEQRAPVHHHFYMRLIPYPTVTLNVLLALGIVLYIALTWRTSRWAEDGIELRALCRPRGPAVGPGPRERC